MWPSRARVGRDRDLPEPANFRPHARARLQTMAKTRVFSFFPSPPAPRPAPWLRPRPALPRVGGVAGRAYSGFARELRRPTRLAGEAGLCMRDLSVRELQKGVRRGERVLQGARASRGAGPSLRAEAGSRSLAGAWGGGGKRVIPATVRSGAWGPLFFPGLKVEPGILRGQCAAPLPRVGATPRLGAGWGERPVPPSLGSLEVCGVGAGLALPQALRAPAARSTLTALSSLSCRQPGPLRSYDPWAGVGWAVRQRPVSTWFRNWSSLGSLFGLSGRSGSHDPALVRHLVAHLRLSAPPSFGRHPRIYSVKTLRLFPMSLSFSLQNAEAGRALTAPRREGSACFVQELGFRR